MGYNVDMKTRVRFWRTKRGLSLFALGQRVGLTHVGILMIERGDSDPKLSTLQKLAKGLRVEVVDLLPRKRMTRRRR